MIRGGYVDMQVGREKGQQMLNRLEKMYMQVEKTYVHAWDKGFFFGF